jgi:protein subunit release factor A
MQFFDEDDIYIESIWCGEQSGTMLRAKHIPTGIVVERIIGFEEQAAHRREIRKEVSKRFSAQFPPEDFVIEHIWRGTGKGAALRLCHKPTGIFVERVVGYEAQTPHRRQMLCELFAKLTSHQRSQNP